jgi:hypothetical protein
MSESEQPKSADESVDFREYFDRRAEVTRVIEEELRVKAEQLIALIPAELQEWKDTENFSDVESTAKWLEECQKYLATEEGYTFKVLTDKEEETGNGLKSHADAERKFMLLKEAWKGIIDVKIINRRKEYFRLNLRFAKKQEA